MVIVIDFSVIVIVIDYCMKNPKVTVTVIDYFIFTHKILEYFDYTRDYRSNIYILFLFNLKYKQTDKNLVISFESCCTGMSCVILFELCYTGVPFVILGELLMFLMRRHN